jgi:hypothetical protein
MQNTRIKISTIVENLLPDYVGESFPLASEFLKQYYKSLESKGNTLDVLQNIDQYIKLDNNSNLNENITVSSEIEFFDSEITLNGGFKLPNSHGIIQIDDEIILYRSKKTLNQTQVLLKDCVRGFSGITDFKSSTKDDVLEFSSSEVSSHSPGTTVKNLSNLILQEFFIKVKKQFAPGFDDESLFPDLNQNIFVKQLKDFYNSKGTDESFKILFKALYNEKVTVIKPQEFLFIPSNAEYRISRNLVVELISGDIFSIEGKTIFQNESPIADTASATVNRVQLIERSNRTYYILSLDFDKDKDINLRGSVSGNFLIGPKTTLTEKRSIGDDNLSVDSTVGFPKNSGELIVFLENGLSYTLSYGETSNNQFYNIFNLQTGSGLPVDLDPGTEIYYNNFCFGETGDGNKVEFRVTGVLSDIELEDNFGQEKGGTVIFKNLGRIEENNVAANNWLFNLPISYDVKSISLASSSPESYTYNLELYDENILKTGDIIELVSSTPSVFDIENPIVVTTDKNFSLSINQPLNTNLKYKVNRKIKKFNYELDAFQSEDSGKYNSDIQNVYYGENNEIYVCSTGLPNYRNSQINPKSSVVNLFSNTLVTEVENNLNSDIIDKIINLGTQNPHPFVTGDEVYYTLGDGARLSLEENKPYYVKKVSDFQIKLAFTRSNILTENFVDVSLIETEDSSLLGDGHKISKYFSRFSFNGKVISENLIRKIDKPNLSRSSFGIEIGDIINDTNANETKPGFTGIFINGTEILNYKSSDKIYFNKIDSISVIDPGSEYDLLNPPLLKITDDNGSGCLSSINIVGELKEIKVLDGGFNYLEIPRVEISGGNGRNAEAVPVMELYEYSVNFNSSSSNSLINLNSGTIGFSTYHNLTDGEEISYEISPDSEPLGGLFPGGRYFVGVIDETTIRLYSNRLDANQKLNQVLFSEYGTGRSTIRCLTEKNKINSFTINSGGFQYSNKKVLVNSTGINTYSNSITCQDLHRFSQNDKIVYKTSGSTIGGISTSEVYYVNIIDNFSFSISTSINSSPVNLTSSGIGTHIFEYEPISVEVIGLSQFNREVKIKPIFRGPIESIYLENGGSNYGSSEIVNYKKLPNYEIENGFGAQLTPIVVNGKISKVIVNSPGREYYSDPDILVSGSGKSAKLTPVIENNRLVDVIISNPGAGYDPKNTFLTVKSAGFGADLLINLQEWTLNLVENYLNSSSRFSSAKLIDENDIIAIPSPNSFDLSFKVSHGYAPRKLREILLTKSPEEDRNVYSYDLLRVNGEEVESNIHSPIIGWAYDGNPIYGPYGFENNNGSGSIVRMRSGYRLVELENRPSQFALGSFVEDYEYVGSESGSEDYASLDVVLDVHNGRFCVTPEYPNGTYAYFCTVGDNLEEFQGYKKPVFPYVIGNQFYSQPIEYNFDFRSRQSIVNINETKWIRNTYPYNLLKNNSNYEYLNYKLNDRGNLSKISLTDKGVVDNVDILFPGDNYSPGDIVSFEKENNIRRGASAVVSEVEGFNISQITINEEQNFSDLDFYFIPNQEQNGFIGITTVPHKIIDGTSILVSGIKNFITSNNNENQQLFSRNIGVSLNQLILTDPVDSITRTGIVTYFNVSGNLNSPRILENDIYQISDVETVKVLNVDKSSSRIRVIRNFGGFSGPELNDYQYPAGLVILEVPKKFIFVDSVDKTAEYDLPREYYFDPKESLGIGTITTRVSISNPGIGATLVAINAQSIYLPNHNIKNGSQLVYSSNGFFPISISTNGTSSQTLTDGTILFATVFDRNFIGLSTTRVGISTSTGLFTSSSNQSNLLYFNDFGTGEYHTLSFIPNTFNKGKLNTNIPTITIDDENVESVDDFINVGDDIRLNVISGLSTSFKVFYNKENRRIVFDKRDYVSSSINLLENSIRIERHGFYNGQKVVYLSDSVGVLEDNKIYYVVVVDKNNIKLALSLEKATALIPDVIDLSSVDGSLAKINPQIELTRNQRLTFDLSDSSLSFVRNSEIYSAFKLNFYSDANFTELLTNTKTVSDLKISKTGQIGITSTASLSVEVSDNWPEVVHYKFDFDNLSILPSDKGELIVDREIQNFNQILTLPSKYVGKFTVVGVTTNSFDINLNDNAEFNNYNKNNSIIQYFSKSPVNKGKITEIKVIDNGFGYKSLPGISSIYSESIITSDLGEGNGAILSVKSNSIGKVRKVDIENIGSDYYSDYSLRPSAKLPDIIKVEPFSSIEKVDVISPGKNYVVAPKLLVFDGVTDELDQNIVLDFNVEDETVDVIKNSNGLFNKTPRIVPISNTNGIAIGDITYDDENNEVTVFLLQGFSLNSSEFPFEVGDRVLIENVSVGIGTENSDGEFEVSETGKGYNSSNYNYKLFTLTEIDENIGGFGSVTFLLDGFISSGENPGVFNSELSSSASIIPEKYLPVFDIKLRKNEFLIGETVQTESADGVVERWDSINEILSVSTVDTFKSNEVILGKSSFSTARISKVNTFNATYVVEGSAVVNERWKTESGFLNNSFQRTPDNDYYQYFSYSLNSKKEFNEWEPKVSELNHIAGFKKFSDLIIESPENLNDLNISTEAVLSEVSVVSSFVEFIDLNCYNYFDLVTENEFTFSDLILSDEITLKNREILSFIESVSNRVLIIDDISQFFDNNPRLTPFSVVDTFNIDEINYKKYFIYVKDKVFDSDKQFGIVSLLVDSIGYINQYGIIDSNNILGSFDFSSTGTEGRLEFYPGNFEVNDYFISLISFSILDQVSGISTSIFGTISNVETIETQIQPSEVGIGTTSILRLPGSTRTSKLIVCLNNDGDVSSNSPSYNEVSEFTIVKDDNNDISIVQYGSITSLFQDSILDSSSYDAYYDNISGEIVFELSSNISIGSTVNLTTWAISLSSSGIGSTEFKFNNSTILTSYTEIPSSPTPGISTISTHSLNYPGSYYIVSVGDTIGNNYRTSEINLLVDDNNDCLLSEFGLVETGDRLCSFGATVNGSNVDLQIIPAENVGLEVRVFSISVGIAHEFVDPDSLTFDSLDISVRNEEYIGTERDVRKEFDLFYKTNPIFERVINPQDTKNLSIVENRFISIPNYFVTGEEIVYDSSLGSPIGIATTTITGIGSTDKLPSKLFAVRIDERSFRVAATAEDALKFRPNLLEITSTGIGTVHKFTSTKQNNKSLISIDNIIQSPVVSTSTTTLLTSSIKLKDVRIQVEDSSLFETGDLVAIDDEICKIRTVGFGSTNTILVDRNVLGSGISTHTSGSLFTKLLGDYNISRNTLFFKDAPFGKTPRSNPDSEFPDEIDWTGITTSSRFSGRVFLRSGEVDSTEETYTENYIFDNISEQFNGIDESYKLTLGGQDVTGISTSNVVVLLKNILQIPKNRDIVDTRGNYTVVGTGTDTSLVFDRGSSVGSIDVNTTNLPSGGVIVSLSSRGGTGYQTLISAGATAVVSSAGTIQSLSIGSTGSGYRKQSKYQINSNTTQNIGSGTTIIFIENNESVLRKLAYASSSTIDIGELIKNASIVGYSTNRVLIGSGSTSSTTIPSGSSVLISINDPSSALIDIEITSYDTDSSVHLGFTTSKDGYISTNAIITNPGTSYTNFPLKFETTTSSVVSIGSTIIPISSLGNVNVGDYISVGVLPLTQIVGLGSTSVLISTSSTISSSISSGQIVKIKELNPPRINFQHPLSYENLPLTYSSSTPFGVGVGTNAFVDIVVGQNGEIFDFDLVKTGYGYKKGDVLTINVDSESLAGIPTDTSKVFEEFQIVVDEIYNDKYSAWSVGDILVLDPFDDLFDGRRKTFPISINGFLKSLRARRGSNIEIQATLLIVINEVLQVPGESYTITGGSIITFKEAPKFGDKSYILFYAGTSSVDIRDVEVEQTIKVGDTVRITSDDILLDQNDRTVYSILSSDIFSTNVYNGPGISSTAVRSLNWCLQDEDKIINGEKVSKDRETYEPSIFQTTKLLQGIGVGSTEAFVESISTLFNSAFENTASTYQNKIKIISNEVLVGASATCNVSASGTITSFNISNFGSGYSEAPSVTIQSPVGIGSSGRAICSSTVVDGKLSSIEIINPGIGYTLGPISSLSIISSGSGYPTGLNTSKENNIFYGAKLKSLDGNGFGASVNIGIENDSINYLEIVSGGNGYFNGENVFVDVFDNENLKDEQRNTLLTEPAVFEVSGVDSPLVLISPPNSPVEIIENVTYKGDYGVIVGMGTTGSLFFLDLFIPYDSPLRDSSVGFSTTLSGIQTGYYFVAKNTNLGNGSISLNNDESLIGIGTSCFDNIYQVFDKIDFERDIPGIGVTFITRITTKVQDLSTVEFPDIASFDDDDFTFDSTILTWDNHALDSRIYGEYSWGRISIPRRSNPLEFTAYTNNGVVGLATNPSISRLNPLRFKNYI